ncbi:MAG: CpsD/CapB family tyrosine-protein kinase [Thermodesulfobacteriota bacterium]
MGKTYEALKRAEAERAAKSAREAAPSPEPTVSATETHVDTGGTLPTPVERSWFRFGGRMRRNGSSGAGANGGENGNGYRNGRNGNGLGQFSFDVPPTTIEEFQQLRKNILATRAPRSLQLMLVVSSRHGEGATTTTALLGSTMAQAGRCLLIDANFRTPGISRVFGGHDAPGFCEALADPTTPGPVHYHPTEIPNLYFMPTGRGPARVPYMFEGRAFDELIAFLRKDFDCILIDGAPMEMYADSSFLAPRADGVMLVVRAESTPLGAPAVSLRELERVGAHVLGAVLNRTQTFIPEFLTRLTNPQDVVEIAVIPQEASR